MAKESHHVHTLFRAAACFVSVPRLIEVVVPCLAWLMRHLKKDDFTRTYREQRMNLRSDIFAQSRKARFSSSQRIHWGDEDLTEPRPVPTSDTACCFRQAVWKRSPQASTSVGSSVPCCSSSRQMTQVQTCTSSFCARDWIAITTITTKDSIILAVDSHLRLRKFSRQEAAFTGCNSVHACD